MVTEDRAIVKQDFAAKDLIAYCMRGGTVGHLWNAETFESCWFNVADLGTGKIVVPPCFRKGNSFFGVFPLVAIPTESKRGDTNPKKIRPQIAYVQCINVVAVDIDGKEMVDATEFRCHLPADYKQMGKTEQADAVKAAKEKEFYSNPAKYKRRALALAESMALPASVIVDSGGGYHVYHFLVETVYLDDGNRNEVKNTIRDWAAMHSGDTAAALLTQILRPPGYYNNKAGFGDNKPQVKIIHYDPTAVYDYAQIEELAGDWAYTNGKRPKEQTPSGCQQGFDGGSMGEVRRLFNERYRIKDMMIKCGYTLCSEDESGFTRLARPGRKVPSVTILPANGTMPEIAVPHSGNDGLHQSQTGRSKAGLDAFAVYAHLKHEGKIVAAYVAAKKHLGLWEVREDDGIN